MRPAGRRGARSYRLPLAAGEFARIVVEQQGLDLVVALFGPDGKELAEVDSPFGERGPEPVFWVAETAGSYRVEVRSLATDAAPGGYEIKLEERRVAVPSDEKLLRAQKSYAEGLGLMSQGTAEASRRALEKFEQSLRLWQAAGEREREAAVLDILGLINDNLGEKREALACYNRALPVLAVVVAGFIAQDAVVIDRVVVRRRASAEFGVRDAVLENAP